MKLIELLNVIKDDTCVSVFDEANFLLGFYDGKNSIDEKLNDEKVIEVTATDNEVLITVQGLPNWME